MDGLTFVTNVHALALDHPIILHAVVRRVFIYFHAYGITHIHMAKIRISDVLDNKITPEDVMKEIEGTYSKEVKNVSKNKAKGSATKVCS